jgi:hypothetical protein
MLSVAVWDVECGNAGVVVMIVAVVVVSVGSGSSISSNSSFSSSNSSKGKAIPLQTLTGPEESRRLRIPDFKTFGT